MTLKEINDKPKPLTITGRDFKEAFGEVTALRLVPDLDDSESIRIDDDPAGGHIWIRVKDESPN